MVRIERLSPIAACKEASALLRAAWTPPAVHYSAEYLAWQLSFPGPEPLAVGTIDPEGVLVGFAAATPRRLRLGETLDFAYLLSFVAVHPQQRGEGLAAHLYAALLAEITPTGRPIVTFAAEGTAGERALLRAYPASGWELSVPIACTVQGGLPRATPEDVVIQASPEPESVAALADACGAESVLRSVPDSDALAHFTSGSGRKVVRVDSADGSPVAAGIVASAEFVTAEGVHRSPVVEAFFCPDSARAANALQTLCHYAATHAEGTGPVLFYNLQGVDAAALRAAGLRRTPTPFRAFLAAPDGSDHPFLQATATSLEIV